MGSGDGHGGSHHLLTTVRVAVGRVLLVAGILILLFIPYLLWGTGLITARNQSALTQQFREAQLKSHSHPATTIPDPQHTTPAAVQVAPTVAGPPAGSPVGTIQIPKINLAMTVVEGTDEAQLAMGPGHYPGTPLPGQAGNAAIAGHRTTYLHPFYSLDALTTGDTIYVTTLQGTFLYVVYKSQVVLPTEVDVVAPTPTPQLTLTTCNPRFSASQRLVVSAKLVASELAHPTGTPVAASSRHHHAAPSATATTATGRDWLPAILWGLLVAALATGVWMVAIRTHRLRRALTIVAGLLVWLVVVFYFFQAVTPLLPASY
jgi:sortase A